MSSKTKHPRAAALAVAKELCFALAAARACALNEAEMRPYMVVAGSLRRGKAEVGDVELVCVPAFGDVQDGLFTKQGSLLDVALSDLLEKGVLAKRKNTNGHEMWGASNKFAVHVASGIPVDIFITTAPHWYNYLVCRTGGADNNTAIATAAKARGLKWHPTHSGFSVEEADQASAIFNQPLRPGQLLQVTSEQDVFTFAGLPYLNPQERP